MLAMVVLLVLCVGAVSAASDIDSVDLSDDNSDIITLSEESENGNIIGDNDTVNTTENGTNVTINVPESVNVDIEDKEVKFNIKLLNESTEIPLVKEDLKLTFIHDGEYTIIDNENINLDNGVISFKLTDIGSSLHGILNIFYKNGTTNISSEANIDLKFSTSNIITVDTNSNIQLGIDKNITFMLNVTDKNKKFINVTKDDFIVIITYIGVNSDNYTYLVEDFNFTIITKNITNKNKENITINIPKFSFYANEIEGDFNHAVLNITYKNDTLDEAFTTKTVSFIEINTIKEESSTKYQNAYITIQLWDNYHNVSVINQSVRFYLEECIFGKGISTTNTTNNEGKTKISLDYIYSFGSAYIPIGNFYNAIVSCNDLFAIGQNVTINITKSTGTFSASNYSSTYASGKKFSIKLVNSNTKKAIVNSKIRARVWFDSKSYQDFYLYTNGSGIANIGVNLGAGKYKVQIYNANGNLSASGITRYITVKKITAKIYAAKVTAYYNYGSKFRVRMVNSNGVALKGASVLLNVFTGSKFKAVRLTTDDNGYAYWTVSGISIATHRVLVGSGSNGATAKVVQTYIYLKKGKTTVTAPVVTNKYKQSAYLKITVKNAGGTKKPLSGIALTVKVYTGKTYKTYTIKTNSKGVASLNTKVFSKGTHKVVITSTNKYYTVSKSGNLIVIK